MKDIIEDKWQPLVCGRCGIKQRCLEVIDYKQYCRNCAKKVKVPRKI